LGDLLLRQGGWVCSDVFDHTSQFQFPSPVFGAQGDDVYTTVDGHRVVQDLGQGEPWPPSTNPA